MNDVVNETILVLEDKIETERLDKLNKAIKAGTISCVCGERINESDIDSYEISSGGVFVDDKRVWILVKCYKCGHVDNWRTVMNRNDI